MVSPKRNAGSAETPQFKQLPVSAFRLDGGTQARKELDRVVIHEYAEKMKEGIAFPPVIAFFDGTHYWLADGFHRVEAATEAGRSRLKVEIHQGTQRDALLFAVGANAKHGLRRTNADKRRAVELLLADEEWRKWSAREIARHCGVSQTLVSNLKAELTDNGVQSGEGTGLCRYVTRHGTEAVMNTAKINMSRSKTGNAGPSIPLRPLPSGVLDQSNLLDAGQRQDFMRLEALDETTCDLVFDVIASGGACSVEAAQRVVAQAALDACPPTGPRVETRVASPATDSSRSVVLDPFAGAAATGIAALLVNRHLVGIELSEASATESAARLREETGVEGSLVECRDLVLPSGTKPTWSVVRGDACAVLRALPPQTAQTCITSPPNLWARTYGTAPQVLGGNEACEHAWADDGPRHGPATQFSGRVCEKCGAWFGELGHEPSVEQYVAHLVLVFDEVKRTLRDDGTLWLNLGDVYESAQLVGVPWQVALALKKAGWILRQDVIWARGASGQRAVQDQVRKALEEEGISESQQDAVLGRIDVYVGSTKPESVENRPAGSHEHIFLFAKNQDYLYDGHAVREESVLPGRQPSRVGGTKGLATQHSPGGAPSGDTRNLRSVWLCPTRPYHGAHVASFPPDLVLLCVKACTVPVEAEASEEAGASNGPKWDGDEAAPPTPEAQPEPPTAEPPAPEQPAPEQPEPPAPETPASELAPEPPVMRVSVLRPTFVGVVTGRHGYTATIDITGEVLACTPVPTEKKGACDAEGVARLVKSWSEAGVEEVMVEAPPIDGLGDAASLRAGQDYRVWSGALLTHGVRHEKAPEGWRSGIENEVEEAGLAFPDVELCAVERGSTCRSRTKARALLVAQYLMLHRARGQEDNSAGTPAEHRQRGNRALSDWGSQRTGPAEGP